jgi:hypothetical protein
LRINWLIVGIVSLLASANGHHGQTPTPDLPR